MMTRNRLIVAGLLLLSFAGMARAELPPNEMGNVMVLMYHQIRSPEGEWARSPEGFRHDLETLYENGYSLVNLVDLIDGRLKVPAGRSPVVLTFDDGAVGQFRKRNGNWDPDSAVGMIEKMHRKHPEFGMAGSFYINPAPRGQDWSAMLQEMVNMGFELGNHTRTHPKLNKLDQAAVEKELAGLQHWVERNVPNYRIRTMAMPFGIYPRNVDWAVSGEFRGVRYHNEALLEVGSNPAPSPYSVKFRTLHIPRVRGSEPYFSKAIRYFNQYPEKRFVSDGDPNTITVPASRKAELRAELSSQFHVSTH